MLKVRLYRPFSVEHFVARPARRPSKPSRCWTAPRSRAPWRAALPGRGHGAARGAMAGSRPAMPSIIGGRYGLSSRSSPRPWSRRSSTNWPSRQPKNHFTVGIVDDVTHTSLDVRPGLRHRGRRRGARDVLSAWARTARWAPTRTPSRSSARRPTTTPRATSSTTPRSPGAVTISHLRFGPKPIRSTYLIDRRTSWPATSSFPRALRRARQASPGATFLLNSPYGPDEVWDTLPREVQEQIMDKKLKFLRHRRLRGGQGHGHGRAHQHHHADLLLRHLGRPAAREAIARIKKSIQKTYGRKGDDVVQQNFAAVDHTLAHLYEVKVPGPAHQRPSVAADRAGRSAGLRAARDRADDRGQRRRAAGLAPSRSTAPCRPARRSGRSATSRWRSRCGTRHLHPVQQVRAGLPARGHPHQGL